MSKRDLRRNRKKNTSSKGMRRVVIILVTIILLLSIALAVKTIFEQNRNREIARENKERLNILFEELNKATTEKITLPNGEETLKNDTVINVITLGEILCEDGILNDAYNNQDGTYNFSHMFEKISNHTANADITIGLLETNFVSETEYSSSNLYNSPKELANSLKNIGVDILNTANNHALDYGYKGVTDTLDYLNEIGIETVGTYKTEKAAGNILIKDVQGIKLAFLSYTYGTNIRLDSVPESTFCINVINKEKMKADIAKAREQGADYVFVNVHWGNVNSSIQNNEQKALADFLFENGADFILGSHPASLQPMEVRQTEVEKNVFIAYSTGNFISASQYNNSNIEMILNIEITKSATTGEIYLSKVTYVPVCLIDNGKESQNRYTLVDIEQEIKNYEIGKSQINEDTYYQLQEAIVKIESLIGKE